MPWRSDDELQRPLQPSRTKCPKYLSVQLVLLTLHNRSGVDKGVYAGEERAKASRRRRRGASGSPSTSSITNKTISSNKKKKDAYASKHLPESIQVPDAIVDCDQLLREYWSVKRGTRSERVWNRLCNKLATWTPADRRKALEAAIASGWADVYEPKPDRSNTTSTSTVDFEALDNMKTPW